MPTHSPHTHATRIQVALPVPVGDFFDYLCPIAMPLPDVGARVQVPFGKRVLIGIVVGFGHNNADASTIPEHKLKTIDAIIDNEAILPEPTLLLARWLSSYYHYPLGETLAVMLPSFIKQGKALTTSTPHWRTLSSMPKPASDKSAPEQDLLPKNAKRLRHALDTIRLLGKDKGVSSEALAQLGITKATLAKLAEKKLISCFDKPPAKPAPAHQKHDAPTLNSEQALALNTIHQALHAQDGKGRYQGFLLQGITGSGKTEVYLQAMALALSQGKQVLVLVPEIGLTPQTQSRFSERFEARVLVLHSNLSDGERLAGWQACKDGQAQIIIATRSALLYPFAQLGLIIIDEAHDISYKQQDHLRYHACDVALYIGYQLSVPVILGSATPSLEQLNLVHTGKLSALYLTTRAGGAQPPRYHLIDRRTSNHSHSNLDGTTQSSAFSLPSLHEMRTRLARGEQVLVFLNRRGYAPVLLCQACGWQANCPRCSSHLTLHKRTLNHTHQHDHLRCHHCQWQAALPPHCPDCHSENLSSLGMGTAKLFEELHARFANPQTSHRTYPILQIDRDTTSKKGDWQRLYDKVLTGEPMILLGTQMLAKGHHFPDVTLVVVVDADAGFLSPNFRSPEHTAQTIIQVAGRAGRGKKAGDVFIQTLQPDNPLLNLLIKDGYDALAQQLLTERKRLALPPYSHAALITAVHAQHQKATDAISALKASLPPDHPFAVLAPVDAPILKKNHQHHVQMLILAKSRPPLHTLLSWWWKQVQSLSSSRGVRLTLDIDPMGW